MTITIAMSWWMIPAGALIAGIVAFIIDAGKPSYGWYDPGPIAGMAALVCAFAFAIAFTLGHYL